MYKRVLPLVLILFIGIQAYSQSGSIQGQVLDSETSEGVPFATVALLADGSSVPVGGVTTSIDGEFQITDVAQGTYNLSVSFMGYVTQEIPNIVVSNQNPRVILAPIALSPSSVELDEVEVTAMARTVVNRLDRRTYRAEDFGTARGGTAVEVLNRLPSLSVSPDGEVSIRGTTDFMVYLNGKPTQLEPSVLLAQISAESIESIDIITVPTAQFDAQGKGGIINITTRTSGLEGFSLSVNGLLGGAPWGHRYEPYSDYTLTDSRYGGGVNLMYANDGWVLYGGLSYSWRDANSSRSGAARILNEANDSYKHMVASGMKPEWYQNYSANLGFEAKLTNRSHLSASYYHGSRTEWRQAFYFYNIFNADQHKNPIEGISTDNHWIYNPNEGIRRGTFHTVNADYTFTFNPTATLKFSGLYEHSVLTHDVDNPNIAYNPDTDELEETLQHYRQTDSTPLDGLRLSADFTKEFDSGHSLSLGVQPQLFGIAGDFSYDTLNVTSQAWGAYTQLENSIDLTRGIYAGYIDFGGKLGELSYKTGIRVEYTDQVMDIDNPDYFTLFDRATTARHTQQQLDWFPSLHASYPVFERDIIGLAASRRISRAPIKNMAPFLYRRHLEVYLVGDPALKPEYINTVELSYSKALGQQRVTLTGFYRGVDNAVFRVNTVYEEEMVLIRSFTNSGSTTALGAELNSNLELGSRTKLFLGGSLYDYRVQADIFGYQEDQRALSWSLKASANVMVTRGLRLSADFDLQSPQVTAQGRNEMRYITNVALSYTPTSHQGWTFSLRGLNLLNSNTRELSTRAYNAEGTQIFYQDTEFYWYGPIVEMGITYNLNWNGQQRRAESEFGRDEF